MRGVAAQRIVRTIRKPRNNADEAIAPKPGGDGAFRAICFVARLANSACYLASPCFAHLIPESLRRDHAGLIQRFLRRQVGFPHPDSAARPKRRSDVDDVSTRPED